MSSKRNAFWPEFDCPAGAKSDSKRITFRSEFDRPAGAKSGSKRNAFRPEFDGLNLTVQQVLNRALNETLSGLVSLTDR